MALKILIFVCERRASFMELSIAIIATNIITNITIIFATYFAFPVFFLRVF